MLDNPVIAVVLDEPVLAEVQGESAPNVTLDNQPVTAVVSEEPMVAAVTGEPTLVVTLGAQQGPAGPPGEGTSDPVLRTDYSGLRFWYVEHSSRIKRIDLSTSPAGVDFATGAWIDRTTLGYA